MSDVESFVVAATSGRCERARRLLDARPEIARDPWAALVLGRGWDGDAQTRGGPRGWAPLLYVAHSCFASADLARELLARGADPNATFTNEYGEMSALYGAAGVVHDAELTRVLLEAGADPDDGESLYHAAEAEDPAILRLLLEHGADAGERAALAHAIDYDRREHVRALLDAGADPNLIRFAVRRGASPEMLRLLCEHGATPDDDAYENAVLRGREDLAATLEELGAPTEVSPEVRAVAAVARGERATLPEDLDPDAREVLILAALRGRLDAVVDALGPAFAGSVGGGPSGQLLHHACWVGDPAVVRRLLERGADPVARSGAEGGTPVAWAALGSQYHGLPGRDYVAVVEALLQAGAELEPRSADVAEGPLAQWLEARA